MKTGKYYAVLSYPENGLHILGGSVTPEQAILDAVQNRADMKQVALYEVDSELGNEIDEQGDSQMLALRIMGHKRIKLPTDAAGNEIVFDGSPHPDEIEAAFRGELASQLSE